MKTFLSSDIGRLRLASLLDGISYVVLVGIAMPIKYLGGVPSAVRVPGMIHGGLFVLLCLGILFALLNRKLPFLWAVITFVCALLPIAPFFLDRKLKQFQPN